METTVEPKGDSFNFIVANAFDLETREFKWLDSIFLGNYVEIRLGYLDQLETVFYGIITAVRLIIRGRCDAFNYYAYGHLFSDDERIHSASWKKKKQSEVVREIGSRYVDKFVIDDTKKSSGLLCKMLSRTFISLPGSPREQF